MLSDGTLYHASGTPCQALQQLTQRGFCAYRGLAGSWARVLTSHRPSERPGSCRPHSQSRPACCLRPTCWRATACCRHWARASHARSSSAQRPSSFWHCSRTRGAWGCPEAARLCPEPSTRCTCPWWAFTSSQSSCHRTGGGAAASRSPLVTGGPGTEPWLRLRAPLGQNSWAGSNWGQRLRNRDTLISESAF